MEKVLLAIDGISPDEKAFNYAVELCVRIKAELKVLHIVNPQKISGCLEIMKKTVNQVSQFFEDSMMAVTFAEAGEHDTADAFMSEAMENIKKLLPESEKAGVPCHVTMKSGSAREEIVSFVRKNKDVVIAVYDTMGDEPELSSRKKKNALKSISKTLSIPVVTVQNNN